VEKETIRLIIELGYTDGIVTEHTIARQQLCNQLAIMNVLEKLSAPDTVTSLKMATEQTERLLGVMEQERDSVRKNALKFKEG
jgi:hypothetical protein